MIESFDGEYSWLSNFYPSQVILDDVSYPAVENAYQAAKTLCLNARKFFPTYSASQSKRNGRLIPIRKDWEEVKLSVMEDLIRQKFAQEPLKAKLIATGTQHIQEGNYWGDFYWGVCRGRGENHLGKIIMKIRSELNQSL